MNKVKFPFFDAINFNLLDENYETNITIDDNEISLDLNFTKKKVDQSTIETLKVFLTQLNQINKSCINKYISQFKNNGEAFDYIQFHIEEMDLEENADNLLINNIELQRIGLYPSEEIPFFAVFDYELFTEFGLSGQILVVQCDSKGNPVEVTWES